MGELRKLQAEWYRRLAQEGFEDAEDHTQPNRPLKEWHSFKFISETVQIRQERTQDYQEKAEEFFYGPAVDEVYHLIVKHGNSGFQMPQVKLIWELHVAGFTERKIALQLDRPKTTIHDMIERIRTWMNLL